MDNMMYCWGCGKEIHATAPTCPHCGVDQRRSKSGMPWGTGRMVFYSIFSLLIPIAGLGAGLQGLLSAGKRKQGALLLMLGVIGAVIYTVVAMRPQYVQPDERFLRSELMVRPGISEVGLSVGQFVEALKLAKMDNGRSPELKGWTKNDNEYTLSVVMKQPIELKFTHLLAPPISGKASVLAPIQAGLEELPAMQFLLSVIAMIPEQAKPQARVAASPQPVPQAESQVSAQKPVADVTVKKDSDGTVERSGLCKGLDLAITAQQYECFDRKFKVADDALNGRYKDLMAKLDDTQKAALRNSQRAWIKEKETKCEKAGDEFKGGTMEGILIADCKVQMTEQRVVFLNTYKP